MLDRAYDVVPSMIIYYHTHCTSESVSFEAYPKPFFLSHAFLGHVLGGRKLNALSLSLLVSCQ